MKPCPTRREFLKTAGAAGSWVRTVIDSAEAATATPKGSLFEFRAVEAEVECRAWKYLAERRLVVNYYRVGTG